jgi:hypothetical protein
VKKKGKEKTHMVSTNKSVGNLVPNKVKTPKAPDFVGKIRIHRFLANQIVAELVANPGTDSVNLQTAVWVGNEKNKNFLTLELGSTYGLFSGLFPPPKPENENIPTALDFIKKKVAA